MTFRCVPNPFASRQCPLLRFLCASRHPRAFRIIERCCDLPTPCACRKRLQAHNAAALHRFFVLCAGCAFFGFPAKMASGRGVSGDPVRFPPMGVVDLSSVRYTVELDRPRIICAILHNGRGHNIAVPHNGCGHNPSRIYAILHNGRGHNIAIPQ